MPINRDREIRRYSGVVAAGLASLELDKVADPRSKRSRRWRLPHLLTVLLTGMTAGCKNLKTVERLTEQLSPAIRRRLGIYRRVPDTTLRDLIMLLPLISLRLILCRQTCNAHRRKQLRPVSLPFGVLAIDGKYTSTRLPDEHYAQRRKGHGAVVRTLTCSLVSAAAPVCIDAKPLTAKQSESSAFPELLNELAESYGHLNLYKLISCDAGFTSEHNARQVLSHGLDYLFALKDNQPTLRDEADRLLARRRDDEADAMTENRIDNQTVEIRRLWRTDEIASYHWGHLRQVIRVCREVRRDDGTIRSRDDRFFVTSLATNRLSHIELLRVIRGHWRVENECHGTWDRVLREDDRPWLHDARGMIGVILLRRIASNMLALYRNVTRRGEKKALIPWAEMMDWLRLALVAADEDHLKELRWSALRGRVPRQVQLMGH